MKSKQIPLPVLGVDVLSDETAMSDKVVREAANVDLGRSGAFSRRDGYARVVSGDDFHSLEYLPQRGWTVVARRDRLYRLNLTTYELTLLASLDSAHPLRYTEYNGNFYFSSRTTSGWVPAGDTVPRRVGVPTPYVAPSLSAGNGSLPAGTYGLVITLEDSRGEEGGATPVQTIELTAAGGILMANLPQVSGWAVNAYLTSADGEILYHGARFPAVFSTYLLTQPANGRVCSTQFLTPLPAGEFLCWHAGRLYTALGDSLAFSQPMRPHLSDAAHDRIPFQAISFIESVGTGIFVGDSRGVWFLAGEDPSKFALRRASAATAVHGSSILAQGRHFPEKKAPADEPVALWLSDVGYLLGRSDGQVVELEPDRIRIPSPLAGRSAFLLRKGIKQVVTPVNSVAVKVSGAAHDSATS